MLMDFSVNSSAPLAWRPLSKKGAPAPLGVACALRGRATGSEKKGLAPLHTALMTVLLLYIALMSPAQSRLLNLPVALANDLNKYQVLPSVPRQFQTIFDFRFERSSVRVFEHSSVRACESSSDRAFEPSSVRASVRAFEHSSVREFESSDFRRGKLLLKGKKLGRV